MIGAGQIGSVSVQTTSNRGATAEELADRALPKLIAIYQLAAADSVEEHIRRTLLFYLKEAQTAERTTLSGKLIQQGRGNLAQIIGEL